MYTYARTLSVVSCHIIIHFIWIHQVKQATKLEMSTE